MIQRRDFCQWSGAALIGLLLPFSGCSGVDPSITRKLNVPGTLGTINEASTISEIGATYMKKVPTESSETDLVNRLLTDIDGSELPTETDSAMLQKILIQKVKADFENGETIEINGWILSRTEARQCALYNLTQTDS